MLSYFSTTSSFTCDQQCLIIFKLNLNQSQTQPKPNLREKLPNVTTANEETGFYFALLQPVNELQAIPWVYSSTFGLIISISFTLLMKKSMISRGDNNKTNYLADFKANVLSQSFTLHESRVKKCSEFFFVFRRVTLVLMISSLA